MWMRMQSHVPACWVFTELSQSIFFWSTMSSTSSPSSSTTLPSLLPTPTANVNVHNIVHLIYVKLDHNNYLSRKSCHPYNLWTCGLYQWISKISSIFKNDGISTLNPEYTLWIKWGQHLTSWIMATLTEPLLAQVEDPVYSSSYAIKSKLEQNLESASKLQIILLLGNLRRSRKVIPT